MCRSGYFHLHVGPVKVDRYAGRIYTLSETCYLIDCTISTKQAKVLNYLERAVSTVVLLFGANIHSLTCF